MKEEKSTTKTVVRLHMGELLFVAFVVLKLTGTIDWSWWWLVVIVLLF